jgi:hypothetical protein
MAKQCKLLWRNPQSLVATPVGPVPRFLPTGRPECISYFSQSGLVPKATPTLVCDLNDLKSPLLQNRR